MMARLTKREGKIAKRIKDLSDKIMELMNQNFDQGGDADEQIAALTFCTVGIAFASGLNRATFLENMSRSFELMEQYPAIHKEFEETSSGDKNVNH